MKIEEPAHLVCAPADWPYSVEGSSFDYLCSKCARQLQVAPSGLRLMRQRPIVCVCPACFMAAIGAEGVTIEPITDDQLGEFVTLRRNRKGSVN